MLNDEERERLKAGCRRLHGHGPSTPGQYLREVAAWCAEHDVRWDAYGSGDLIEGFEAKVAELLGFDAARFVPSGTLAQQVALRIWCERAGHAHFGMHPTSHLELYEQRGYAHLHGLRATLVGPMHEPLLAEHLLSVKERLAALLVELPIREAGGQLPTLAQLTDLKAAARKCGARLHLDGARLWECAPWFGVPYREICAGFDSVYVSFYKGIGALSGAMLLGPRDFIDEAQLWQRRSGGNLYTLAPSVASAAMRFDQQLTKIPTYVDRARRVAEVLGAIDGVVVLPPLPPTNMMHVFLPMSPELAVERRDAYAGRSGVWLFAAARAADMPGHSRLELSIGDGALDISDEEIDAGFRAIVERR